MASNFPTGLGTGAYMDEVTKPSPLLQQDAASIYDQAGGNLLTRENRDSPWVPSQASGMSSLGVNSPANRKRGGTGVF